MKTQVRTDISSTLTGEQNHFTVAVNAKTFKVLFDQLYANKPRAIIRELWTNAYDSHVAADCPERPFTCALPTHLDPTFTVRDYGVSLTHDEVMRLYTTVFESTKDQTDDYVGQLGLGSKSPFAYTDSFSVIAYRDGERRLYVAAMDASGVPTITHLLTEPSDEETGLEVSLPVQDRHHLDFVREAGHVARGFDVCPELNVTLDQPEVKWAGDGWQVVNRRGAAVRMGCVIYDLNDHDVPMPGSLNYGYGLVVDLPIGAAEVAANRETLSFDDRTAANVDAAFKAATTEILRSLQEYLDESTNLLEAERRYVELREWIRLGRVTFHGGRTQLRGTIGLPLNDPNVPVILNGREARYTSTFNVGSLDRLLFVVERSDQPSKHRRSRLAQFRASLNGSADNLYLLKDPTPRQLRTLVRRLGLRGDQVRNFTTLPEPVIAKRERTKRDANGVVGGVYTVGKFQNPIQYRGAMPADYLWVAIDRSDSRTQVFGTTLLDRRDFQRTIAALVDAFGITKPVLLMNASARKRFKVTDATSLLTHVTACVAAAEDTILAEYRERVTWRLVYAQLTTNDDVDVATRLTGITQPANYHMDGLLDNQVIRKLVDATRIEEARTAASTRCTEIMTRYPLLFGNVDAAAVNAYIDSVSANQA